MDTGIPLFLSEIEYLLLETIPLETIMRVPYQLAALKRQAEDVLFSCCWEVSRRLAQPPNKPKQENV